MAEATNKRGNKNTAQNENAAQAAIANQAPVQDSVGQPAIPASAVKREPKNPYGFGTQLLTVMSSTASMNGGFINKLQFSEILKEVTPFGTKTQQYQRTYYMKTDTQPAIGFSAPMNIDNFRISERPFFVPVEDMKEDDIAQMTAAEQTQGGKTLMLKWLHL